VPEPTRYADAEIGDEQLDTWLVSLDYLGLEEHSAGVLEWRGFTTVRDLQGWTSEELLSIGNITPKIVRQLREALPRFFAGEVDSRTVDVSCVRRLIA